MWPCDKGPVEALYGYGKFWWVVEKVQPEIIFFLNDPWVIEKYLENKPKGANDSYIKYMAYYPIDSGPLKPHWAKMLSEKFDAQVCYSHFAESVITDANEKRPSNLHQIYHGVDTKDFFPIRQDYARNILGLPQDAFIVGMVARNQYRKRFDLLVKAFAEFSKDKPEAKLYLHTALHDVGFDILDLARQFGLKEHKLILTEGLELPDGVPTSTLNLIYNSFDINALISLGDGFGLPVAESMATACPQIVSDHSCLRELVDGHGGLTVKNAAWMLNVSGINTWGGVSDVNDIVTKLNLLYNNRALRIKMAEDAYNFITQDKFKWPQIGRQFNDIINDLQHILPVEKKELALSNY
jgi:glycosyltransferase involved in cell wall biosynthesis